MYYKVTFKRNIHTLISIFSVVVEPGQTLSDGFSERRIMEERRRVGKPINENGSVAHSSEQAEKLFFSLHRHNLHRSKSMSQMLELPA